MRPEHQAPATGQETSPAAFYLPQSDGHFLSTSATIGPWHPSLQHGGPPAALLGRALDALSGEGGKRLSQLSFDFFSPVPVAELQLEASVVRPGKRIQLSTATLSSGGRPAMRATAWHILAETGRSPAISLNEASPALPALETRVLFPELPTFGYGEALEWRFVKGSFAELGPATVWTRCRMPIVAGTALTGLERVLVMVDAANGISSVLPLGQWTFVPVGLTVTVERLPQREWVGMSATTTMSTDGIGLTETRLFDEAGTFGRALQTLYIAPR